MYFYILFVVASLVILADFTLPGRVVTNDILEVEMQRQQSYNAARNYHYSYKVITNEHRFQVSEAFGSLQIVNEQIKYAVSPLFKKVNWYTLLSPENRSYHSLRLVSGLILPLVVLLSMFLKYRYNWKMGSLVFVLQILLIGDLIFLMF